MNNIEIILSTIKLKQITPLLRILVERTQVIPAYSMVLIQPTEQGIWMTVGNMESQLSCFVPGKIVKEGESGLVSAVSFFEYCRNCPVDTEISLRFSESNVYLECGSYKNKLQTLPVEQFPKLAEESDGYTFHVEEKQLKQALLGTQRSMAVNDVRPYLNGMAFVITQSSLQCVSSDGHRLATTKISTSTNGEFSENSQPVLLRKSVQVLDKILSENEKKIEVSVFETQVVFRNENMVYKVKPIEDQYPDFTKTFPDHAVTKVWLNREDFMRTLHQSLAICDNKVPVAEFSFRDEQLQVVTRNSKNEECDVLLSARLEGDDRAIWFNINYLLDALESLFAKEVKITIDEKGAMMMVGVSETGYPKHVIMSLNR